MEKEEIIEIDGKEYMLASIANKDNETYYFFINVDNPKDTKVCKEIGKENSLEEVMDQVLIKELAFIFYNDLKKDIE